MSWRSRLAARKTSEFYRRTQYGPTLTLRQALEQKRVDCIRATDMISAIYRNAGRPSIGHVRWSTGAFGHSVAAYLGRKMNTRSPAGRRPGSDR